MPLPRPLECWCRVVEFARTGDKSVQCSRKVRWSAEEESEGGDEGGEGGEGAEHGDFGGQEVMFPPFVGHRG